MRTKPPFIPKIEPLDRRHECADFDCGRPALNQYLRHQASQDIRRDVGRVFVARRDGSQKVIGYYSLSAASFSKGDLPPDLARRLPHYPIPAALIGRLGVDKATQGQGLGAYLMVDAFARLLRASQELALYAIVVDAKDGEARTFYLRYGFIAFPETPKRLFLPLETIRQAYSEA